MNNTKNAAYNRNSQHNSKLLPAGLVVVLLLFFGLTATADAAVQPRNRAIVELQAPSQVVVGEAIELMVSVRHARELGGYEALILYDTAAAEFGGLVQRDNDLKQLGRDVGSLAAPSLATGTAIGLYSCPAEDCLQGQANDKPGGNGQIRLARLVIVPQQPGTLEIALGAAKFVDIQGRPLEIQNPQPAVEVEVVSIEEEAAVGQYYPAPEPGWSLVQESGSAVGPLDLTGDGEVDYMDVAEAAVAWQIARLDGAPCGPISDPLVDPETEPLDVQGGRFDVNHDGCLDVADVQFIAANRGTAETSAETGATAEDTDGLVIDPTAAGASSHFVVNAVADGTDAVPGDGQCLTAYGYCTLRAAIMEANAMPGANSVGFNIWGSGVKTIKLTGRLPTISDQSGPLTIDGYTQSGAAPNSDPAVSNAAITIQVEGKGESVHDGFVITSSGNAIRGLAIYKVKRSFWIYGKGANSNVVTGSFIGTNAAGSYGACCLVNSAHGIHIEQESAGNRIGGISAADRNVVSGNAQSGIGIWHYGSNNNVVVNNLFGLNPAGNARLSNRRHGIDLNFGAADNIIGGTGTGERNVSSGNDYSGIEVSHLPETTNNRIVGNFFGTTVSGEQMTNWSYNGYTGVTIEDGASGNVVDRNVVGNALQGGIQLTGFLTLNNRITDNWIGVSPSGTPLGNGLFGIRVDARYTAVGPGNVIAYNQYNGVVIRESDKDFNTITRNSIYGNGAMGIELMPNGVNPNDPGDGDTGPNEGLNFPVILSASTSQVSGTACGSCVVELFKAEGSAGGYGQGKTFLGAVTAASGGSFSLSVTGLNGGDVVTATATDSQGNTSEFSQNVSVGGGTPPPPGTTFVTDGFGRTVSNGWGAANMGGSYTLLWGSAASQSFAVNGSQGTIILASAGQGREAILEEVSLRDVDITFRLQTDKDSDSAGQDILVIGRRLNDGSMYRGRVRLSNGEVRLQFNKGSSGVWSTLTGLALVPGLSHEAGSYIWVRMRLFGTNPTTLQMKSWGEGQAEPGSWQIEVTDSDSVLQGPGAVGLRVFLPGGSTTTPVTFSFDDYLVSAVQP